MPIKLFAVNVLFINQILVRVGDEVFFRDFDHDVKSILRHHNVVQARKICKYLRLLVLKSILISVISINELSFENPRFLFYLNVTIPKPN